MGVRPILERSGLPVDTLRQVWNLSDIDRDGQLLYSHRDQYAGDHARLDEVIAALAPN